VKFGKEKKISSEELKKCGAIGKYW